MISQRLSRFYGKTVGFPRLTRIEMIPSICGKSLRVTKTKQYRKRFVSSKTYKALYEMFCIIARYVPAHGRMQQWSEGANTLAGDIALAGDMLPPNLFPRE